MLNTGKRWDRIRIRLYCFAVIPLSKWEKWIQTILAKCAYSITEPPVSPLICHPSVNGRWYSHKPVSHKPDASSFALHKARALFYISASEMFISATWSRHNTFYISISKMLISINSMKPDTFASVAPF